MSVSYSANKRLSINLTIGPGGIEPPYYNYRLYALPLSYDPTNIIFLYIHTIRIIIHAISLLSNLLPRWKY